MNKKILVAIIIIFIAIAVVIGLRILTDEDSWICQNGEWIKHGNPSAPMPTIPCGGSRPQADLQKNKEGDIIIDEPKSGQIIKSPFIVKGKARGTWFFEASFPAVLVDGNNNELTTVILQAQEDWMTEDFVNFQGELIFNPSVTENGKLIFKNDNPSGLPEFDKEFTIPVLFE